MYVDSVIKDSITYTEHARRNTVTVMDVVNALKCQANTMYGYT